MLREFKVRGNRVLLFSLTNLMCAYVCARSRTRPAFAPSASERPTWRAQICSKNWTAKSMPRKHPCARASICAPTHTRHAVSDGYIDFGEFATAFFGTDAKKSLARTTDWVRQNKQVGLRLCNRVTFLNTRWQLTQQAVARKRQMMQMEVRPSR